MLRFVIAFMLFAFASSSAGAKVTDYSAAGFTVSITVKVSATPDVVWDTLRAPQRWWTKEHTWSGNSSNLYMDNETAGCFCEELPGRGSVVHARLLFVDKGKLLRMEGAFGPLQPYAVTGVMSFELSPDGEKGTTLKMTYAVSGYMPGGFKKMVVPVNCVLSGQVAALKASAEAPLPVIQ